MERRKWCASTVPIRFFPEKQIGKLRSFDYFLIAI